MYRLLLTSAERRAIDWVGNRYSNGDCLYHLLSRCDQEPADVDWSGAEDIVFLVSEPAAWSIGEIADDCWHEWPCFAPELVEKLEVFLAGVV